MTSAVYERTKNLGLGLIEFNFPNWADDANLNMQILDAAMQYLNISIRGSWQNNTQYAEGDLILDSDDGSIWRANISHTSSATGTFAHERTTYPDLWIDASQSIHARGQWMPDTPYYVNDIVYDGYVWALATQAHTSSHNSLNDDIAAGKMVVIFDATSAVEDCEAAATVAMNSATTATAAASTATTNANLATSAASAAAASQAAAASSATSADSSEADAELAADRAEAAAAAMLPDAPVDSKYYGRYNGSWQQVIAEAPNDGTSYGRKNGAWAPAIGAMIVSDAAPTTGLVNGLLWFESDTGNTFMYYTTPSDPDSSQWVHVSGFTSLQPIGGGGIAEAPSDGHTYARRNTAWIDMGGAVPVNEAPNDGKQYVRKNLAWQEVVFPTPPTYPMVFDVNGDAVIKFGAAIVVRIKPSGLILTKDDVEVFSVAVL